MTTNPISLDRLVEVLGIRVTELAIFNPATENIDHSSDLTVLHTEFTLAFELIISNYNPAKNVKKINH